VPSRREFKIGVEVFSLICDCRVGGRRLIVGPNEGEEVTADQLVLRVAHHTRGCGIQIREPALRVAVVNEILRVLDDVAQALSLARRRASAPGDP